MVVFPVAESVTVMILGLQICGTVLFLHVDRRGRYHGTSCWGCYCEYLGFGTVGNRI